MEPGIHKSFDTKHERVCTWTLRFLPVCGPYTEVHVIRSRGCHHKSSLLFWSHYNRTYKAIPVFALDYLHENIYFLS